MSDFRPCAVVPTYENPRTVGRVVRDIHEAGLEVIVVDDGSSAPGEKACQILESDGIATRIRLERNSGKGAAVKAGFQRAAELGFTHALQIDADGQPILSTDVLAGIDTQSDEFNAAFLVCLPILSSAAPVQLGSDPELQAAVQDALRDFSSCMRDEGVEDFPDPAPGFDGTGSPYPLTALDTSDPDVDAANPWGGHTLEWLTESPPAPGNFPGPFVVTSEAPLLDEDFVNPYADAEASS